MFKVVGFSTYKGRTTVRFANDVESRTKILTTDGHTNVKFIELPKAMDKTDAVKYLTGTDLMKTAVYKAAVDAYLNKGSKPVAKAVVLPKKPAQPKADARVAELAVA